MAEKASPPSDLETAHHKVPTTDDVTENQSQVLTQQNNGLILAVDHDAHHREVLKNQLDQLGYQVEFAVDGAQALSAWQQHSYGLILADCGIPLMDGYELAQRIRQSEHRSSGRCIIIAIAENELENQQKRCNEAGIDDFICKPIEFKTLSALLNKWLPVSEESKLESTPEISEKTTSLDNFATLNTEILIDIVGPDKTLHQQLLNQLLISSKTTLDSMTAAFLQHDLDTVGALAHKLKSSTQSCGALNLSHCCASIERAVVNTNWEILNHQHAKLATLYDDLAMAILNNR